VPRGTQEPNESLIFFAYGAITLCDGTFQNPSAKDQIDNSLTCVCRALQPRHILRCAGLGFSPFARHY
jgi:hypothetical protein